MGHDHLRRHSLPQQRENHRETSKKLNSLGLNTGEQGWVLGFQRNKEETAEFIRSFSEAGSHEVVTSLFLSIKKKENENSKGSWLDFNDSALSKVHFIKIPEENIKAYAEVFKEALNFSGGYKIQGLASSFVSNIEGEMTNVIGIPMCLLSQMIIKAMHEAQWIP